MPTKTGKKPTLKGVPPKPPTSYHSAKSSCEQWLRDNMKPGVWYPSRDVQTAAHAVGFSYRVLQRAREAIGLVKPHIRRSSSGVWEWRIPTDS